MNGKEKTRDVIDMIDLAPRQPTRVGLTPAQQKQILRLVNVLGRKQEVSKAAQETAALAQEAADLAQSTANEFLLYCAEEAGVTLGENGWSFDQGALAFVQSEDPLAALAGQEGVVNG